MKKKLLIEVGDDIDLDFIRKNCKTGGPIISPMPEFRAIADGKVLSDMTNGDVLTTIFPNLNFTNVLAKMYAQNGKMLLDWWNAPYRGTEVSK